jgi:nucleotide-binding universal stress UspA family protein
MFKRILAPVDGSPDAWIALEHAVEIGQEEGATIHVLFVADSKLIEAPYRVAATPETVITDTGSAVTQTALAAGRQLARYGKATLDDAQARCAVAGVVCETEYVEGVVANVILNRSTKTDLVVLGQRGAGAEWAGPQLGSVLETIVRHAQAPVLTTQAEMRPFRRILAAFDGSDRATDVLMIAAELASRKARKMIVLTVDDGNAGRHEAWEMGKRLLEKRGQSATHIFCRGHASREILRVANEEACELIALGSHGHSQFIAALFGSTVDEVLHRAVSPVLIYR